MTQIKDIFKIALPAMIENFLQFLMGMIDSYLVAFLGLVAISGVSVANNIITIYQAIFIALGAAISSVVARTFSQEEENSLGKQVSEALTTTVILSVILGLVSLFFGRQMLSLLGTEMAVAQAGGQYVALVGGSIVLLGLMTSFGAILRATGKAQLPMYVSLLANVLNALFSAVAVFGFHLGVVGVALGTIAARIVGCLLLYRALPVRLRDLRWSFHWRSDLFRLALPAAGERLMMRAGDVVIVALIVSLGTAVVAGNSIGETLTQFNYMPGMGIATATVILVAQAQGEKEHIRKIVRASFLFSLVLMFLISGGIFLFGRPLTWLYTQDSQAVATSLLVMLYSFVGTPATAGTLIYTATWQGLGNARLPFYATTIGMWVVRIGLGYLLTISLGWGVSGVWIATILDNLFRWIFLSIFFFRKQRQG